MIHTSSTAQVARTVAATAPRTIGKASQEPVRLRKNVIVDWVRVTATTSTARTAETRTGSGIRRRRAGSSTHRPRLAVPAPPPSSLLMVRPLPTAVRLAYPNTSTPTCPSYRQTSGGAGRFPNPGCLLEWQRSRNE